MRAPMTAAGAVSAPPALSYTDFSVQSAAEQFEHFIHVL